MMRNLDTHKPKPAARPTQPADEGRLLHRWDDLIDPEPLP